MFTFELNKINDTLGSAIHIKKIVVNEPKVLHCELLAEISQKYIIMFTSALKNIEGFADKDKSTKSTETNENKKDANEEEGIKYFLTLASEGKAYFFNQMINLLISRGIAKGIDDRGIAHSLTGKKGFFEELSYNEFIDLCAKVIANFINPFKK